LVRFAPKKHLYGAFGVREKAGKKQKRLWHNAVLAASGDGMFSAKSTAQEFVDD